VIAKCPVGVSIECDANLLAIRADALLRIASTAAYGGGLTDGHCIVSARVPPSYSGLEPARDIQELAAARGLHPEVGLLTAVDLSKARSATVARDGVTAMAVVTAGLRRTWAAGSPPRRVPPVGTINLIVLLDAGLEDAAGLNLIATITEAKVLTLATFGIVTEEGEPASGTATDAVVVAWPAQATPRFRFGGPATLPGWAAAAATRAALGEAIAIWR
jgi:adenosylcobinamide amidohydrolase